jgi:hypothetical protein
MLRKILKERFYENGFIDYINHLQSNFKRKDASILMIILAEPFESY